MAATNLAPDLFAYLDYRAYLRDWFEARKRANPRFSHRMFTRMAGFRSSSVLLHVMRGERNLSTDSIRAFADALALDDDGRAFFRALVELDQASDDAVKNQAWATLSIHRRFREARQLDGEGFRFLSQWYFPAVHQLAAREDFRDDPGWIARSLRPRITPSQASEALAVLRRLALLVPDENGRLRPAEASVVTPSEVSDLAACNYHREMCLRAHDAVAAFEPDQRHLLGITVAIPEHLVPVLKTELNKMQARLLALCDTADGKADGVFQLNLQLLPLSDRRQGT